MNNSLLDTAVVPIQKLENAKPSNAMINMGQSKPTYFSYGGSVAPPEVQLAEPPPINLAFGGVPNVPVVPVAKTVEATTYSGDTVGEGIGNFTNTMPIPRYNYGGEVMDPQLQMIYKAQMDNTGLIKLMNMDYRERI
jgi:hypothetical protein